MTDLSKRLGPTPVDGGTQFAVFSSIAERVEICLVDEAGRENERHDLRRGDGGVWSLHVPGCVPGQRYG